MKKYMHFMTNDEEMTKNPNVYIEIYMYIRQKIHIEFSYDPHLFV